MIPNRSKFNLFFVFRLRFLVLVRSLSQRLFLGNLVAKKLVALNRGSTRDHTLKATVTQISSNFLTLTAHANVEKYPFYSLKKRI